jgi:hypothetical protein
MQAEEETPAPVEPEDAVTPVSSTLCALGYALCFGF